MIINSEINFFDNRFLMFVLDQMAYEYERTGKNVIRMTLGKSELPLHPDINRTIIDAIENFMQSTLVFPAGLPELKEKLSEHYKKKHNLDINPENIIISVGTSTIFRNLFCLFLEKGDDVLLPLPYYSLYHFSALLAGANIRYYEIDLDTLRLDKDSFRENLTEKTKLVVINSPGNPLGNILTKEELYFMDSLVNGQAPIINDEVYDNMCFDEQSPSVMELNNTKSAFITTNSFSKAYRMYSRRVGWCIVPDELITPLTVIQHHTLLTTDPICQFGAIKALDHLDEVEHIRMLYKRRRDYTVERFKDVRDVRAINSLGSFYITLDCTRFMEKKGFFSSLDLATQIMEEKHVATVPGSDFGLPRTLRLSFSCHRYNEGIDHLVDFFNSY
ncbi:MAG: aminotransferase class I/II-fold pyridoxal phosphate-dependent enzyme [Candidatus Aminicenantes bacterium]|nr:aminotransferase class I/II-fold pyridoxal phosphate-dependent enzyme [Candidatus Aminicenantes bacterium]NIM79307.1 aminotransferase class I/II-fold pyridoxal phosphate-dependent enzyme [Candidatus Aminicenantes bacterium]NIN23054.1 aminotransferase class I/II-fold pyridoxal phosphate-dependent enzyme [Candidatus Aminicenantes bacterium]NIN46781.1 aminotransferase class I/II-fold pyridoxal phosphate-dependent enzyme [Candidatus Aminicenantes bacterium]NIN89703.1 aminotransferase class I/II-